VCLIVGYTLFVANVGDSRCIIAKRKSNTTSIRSVGPVACTAKALTNDHRLTNAVEYERVRSLSGVIVGKRVWGILQCTRSFGDLNSKEKDRRIIKTGDEVDVFPGVVVAEPEITVIQLNEKHCFLVVGSDGLWDVFTNSQAVNYVAKFLEMEDLNTVAARLVKEGRKQRMTRDDITAVIVAFG